MSNASPNWWDELWSWDELTPDDTDHIDILKLHTQLTELGILDAEDDRT